jgi:hypothetical protein
MVQCPFNEWYNVPFNEPDNVPFNEPDNVPFNVLFVSFIMNGTNHSLNGTLYHP